MHCASSSQRSIARTVRPRVAQQQRLAPAVASMRRTGLRVQRCSSSRSGARVHLVKASAVMQQVALVQRCTLGVVVRRAGGSASRRCRAPPRGAVAVVPPRGARPCAAGSSSRMLGVREHLQLGEVVAVVVAAEHSTIPRTGAGGSTARLGGAVIGRSAHTARGPDQRPAGCRHDLLVCELAADRRFLQRAGAVRLRVGAAALSRSPVRGACRCCIRVRLAALSGASASWRRRSSPAVAASSTVGQLGGVDQVRPAGLVRRVAMRTSSRR